MKQFNFTEHKLLLTGGLFLNMDLSPNNPIYLRTEFSGEVIKKLIKEVNGVDRNKVLIVLGDSITKLSSLEYFLAIPNCPKILILGNLELNNPNYTIKELKERNKQLQAFDYIIEECRIKTLLGEKEVGFYCSSNPINAFDKSAAAVCGHVNNAWKLQKMKNGFPIISVAWDSWNRIISNREIHYSINQIEKFSEKELVSLW